jgi:hypothetical protein
MSVNKVKLERMGGVDQSVIIPIELSWDYDGIDQSIDVYEEDVITQVIGVGRDFEVSRFANEPYTSITYNNKTEVNYEFYFHSGTSVTNVNNWQVNYLTEGFSAQDVFYYNRNFSNSFFKLDFYDSPDEKQQVNYLTAIIPTQQGLKMPTVMQRQTVEIKKPKFVLDYVGDKEGFFIYWLKKRNFLNISKFYMTAKFYNAQRGTFIRMINQPQSSIPNSQYTFNTLTYFYYILNLDYPKQTYTITTTGGLRLGDPSNPIKWYEYVNPPK